MTYANEYVGAKELSVLPGQSVTVKDAAAHGCIVVLGHGTFGVYEVEAAQMLRYGQLSADEYFVGERGIRGSVIARKISFGSQSDRGMQTREVLMTFLYTARIRGLDPNDTLEKALNMLCHDPKADIAALFGLNEKLSDSSAA